MRDGKNLLDLLHKKEKTHLLIDFDGTLCFLDINWAHWWTGIENILEKFDPDFEHGLEGVKAVELHNNYFERFGEPVWDEVANFTAKYETENLKGYRISNLLLEIVNNDNFKRYLWTSNSCETVTRILRDERLEDKFEKLITRADVFFTKPNPEGFNLIYDESLPKYKYGLIGDSEIDKKAAENSGIEFFNINDYSPSPNLQK